MTVAEVFQVGLAAVGSVAAGGGLVAGVSSWLGKIWAERIAREERRLIEEQLHLLRERSELLLKQMEAQLERQKLVFESSFKLEFDAYQEIWRCLSDVRAAALALRPVGDIVSPTQSEEDRRRERLRDFAKAVPPFGAAVEHRRPFIAEAIYAKLMELTRVLHAEAWDYAREQQERWDAQYWNRAVENAKKIGELSDRVCEMIRKRVTEELSATAGVDRALPPPPTVQAP